MLLNAYMKTQKSIYSPVYKPRSTSRCSLSPTIFNRYIDDMLRYMKNEVHPGIHLNSDTTNNNLLFADDQLIIQQKN